MSSPLFRLSTVRWCSVRSCSRSCVRSASAVPVRRSSRERNPESPAAPSSAEACTAQLVISTASGLRAERRDRASRGVRAASTPAYANAPAAAHASAPAPGNSTPAYRPTATYRNVNTESWPPENEHERGDEREVGRDVDRRERARRARSGPRTAGTRASRRSTARPPRRSPATASRASRARSRRA